MDGYQFIAAIFQSLVSLAWPAAFVIAVALFRDRLSQLLPLLRLKHKDTEVSFRLEQAEQEVKALPAPPAAPALNPTPEELSRFETVAEHSPRAAILEKRADLEQAVRTIAEQRVMETAAKPSRLTFLSSVRLLRNSGFLDEKTSALLDDLRVVGNRAAHGTGEITKEEALRFGKLADSIIKYLEVLS
ncbi:DUF4145 domain-containing protein [Bradyrhizobium sp. LMG 9283]|uniref:DUF4145 domain-containing protein n=1 Tax=Bradyrhizobium sp. LMG 9283 TaxID=592064 RepID=UPI003890CD9C